MKDIEMEIWSPKEERARQLLKELRADHGCVAIRGNVCHLDWDVAAYIKRLSTGVVPNIVKLGGAEDGPGIRMALRIGATGIMVPFAGNPYIVREWLSNLRVHMEEYRYKRMWKAIFIETVSGYNLLDEILKLPEMEDIDTIICGRGDMAKSLGEIGKRDDPETNKIVEDMIRRTAEVGQNVTPISMKLDEFTRRFAKEKSIKTLLGYHVLTNVDNCPDIDLAYEKIAEFDKIMKELILKHYEHTIREAKDSRRAFTPLHKYER